MKWEYTTIYLAHFELSIESNSLVEVLNEMGQIGWQLVAVDNGIIYLKRALGVEVSLESGFRLTGDVKPELEKAAVEEMTNIIEKAVSRLSRRESK